MNSNNMTAVEYIFSEMQKELEKSTDPKYKSVLLQKYGISKPVLTDEELELCES